MKSNYKQLGHFIRQVDVRNTEGKKENLLGVSVQKHFIPSIANTVGTDFSKYKVVKRGQFTYIPDTSRRGDKIGIALLENYEEGLVSNVYTVFEVIDEKKLIPEYLMMWFSRAEFDRYARFKSHGSVREIMDWDEMCKVELPVPTYKEQKKIVERYKTITKRIALKKQINDNLENQVSALYKQLTQSQEPNSTFESIATVQSGKRPNSNDQGSYPLVGAGGIMNYINAFNFDEKILITGRVGTHGVIQRFFSKCWASDNTLVIKSKYYEFAYHFLKSVDWDLLNRGSTQPLVTQTDIKNLEIYIPNSHELNEFETTAEQLMEHQKLILSEISILRQLQEVIISSLSRD